MNLPMDKDIINILLSCQEDHIVGLNVECKYEEIFDEIKSLENENILPNNDSLVGLYSNFKDVVKNLNDNNELELNKSVSLDNCKLKVDNISDSDKDSSRLVNDSCHNSDNSVKRIDDLKSIYKQKNNIKYKYCDLNESLSLPLLFKNIFENYDNLYRLGIGNNQTFITSLFYSVDPMYMTYTKLIKQKLIESLFIKLLNDFNLYFDGNNYRKDGYSKSKMLSILGQNKIDRSIERYLADYFQLNIIVIEVKYEKYYTCSYTNKNFISIIFLKNDDILEPILSVDGIHYFKNIELLLDKYLTKEVKEERKIKEVSYNNEDEKNNKIKLLKKMKLAEIIQIAEKLEICLIDKLTLKKKTKNLLSEEIIKCM